MAKRGQRKKKEVPGIDENFVNEINSLDTAGRKSKIVSLQFLMDESEDFLKNDEGIKELKANLAEAVGPTKDTIKVLKNQTKYIIDNLNGKDTEAQGAM